MDGACLAVYDRPHRMPHTYLPHRFLLHVYGTKPFEEYCRSRGIVFEQIVGFPLKEEDWRRWQHTLRQLPAAQQARIELEFAQVSELADRDALELLSEAARTRGLPPADIPGEEALALWFYLNHFDIFQEVFLRREFGETDGWRAARVPAGIAIKDRARRQALLAASLRSFFHAQDGGGRYCVVDRHDIGPSICFAVYLSDRLRFFDAFTLDGERTIQVTRPAFPVLFVYDQREGRVLLKARQRSADKLLDLFRRFARCVLEHELDADAVEPAFRLDLLKHRREFLPDGEGMGASRVKALHLAYPGRLGRRRLKLETLTGDAPDAIYDLLEQHGGNDTTLEQLQVVYAELQVPLRIDGRNRRHLLRLWRDRCNLGQTPLDQRLRASLKRWGLLYGC
jgi:hypothetical protein